MSRTAAEAAQTAAEWAERAETAFSMASVRRAEGDAAVERRAQSEAAAWYEKAETSERERGIAAGMASMWADVAGALHLVEEGEPK